MPTPSPDNVVQFSPRARRARARPARRPEPENPPGLELGPLIDSWELALKAAHKSPNTLRGYLRCARLLVEFLAEQGMPTDAERVRAEHVRAFLVSEMERASVATAKVHHSNLGVFFSWLIAEEERSSASPVVKADRPKVHATASKYLSDDQIRALLAACKGSDFDARRDTALFRLFADCGVRVGGAISARLANLDLNRRTLLVVLKGGKEHLVPFGAKTAAALDRYLRVRASHPHASSPWLWIGRQTDHLSEDGIRCMMERRAQQAGIDELVHPHRFRSTFARNHLAAGGSVTGAMRVAGWESEAMLRHYTREGEDERARDEHARLNLGDRL